MDLSIIVRRSTFSAKDWVNYFKGNTLLRREIPWERGIAVAPELRGPLVRSLQRFQIGEQGDGLHLRQGASSHEASYQVALDLFIREEQEHSRLLAGLIEGMGGSLLKQHWSDTCFVMLRRLLGLHMELLVLLLVEVIAQVYYRILYEGSTDLVLRSVCAQIMHDEQGHVAFHSSYLRQFFAGHSALTRWLVSLVWGLLFRFVCAVFIYDHRSVLLALGITPRTCWRDCLHTFQETRAFIMTRMVGRLGHPSNLCNKKSEHVSEVMR